MVAKILLFHNHLNSWYAFRQKFIMDTQCSKIIEETDYSMLYDEEFVLLSDSGLIKDDVFRSFSVTVAIWDNFLGFKYKST
jgi:hypothetical protein